MLAGSCSWTAVNKCQNGTAKVAKKAFNMGWFRTQYVAMVTELLGAYRRVQIGWDISFHHYDISTKSGGVYDVITWLICISFLKNLNFSGTKRDIWKQ